MASEQASIEFAPGNGRWSRVATHVALGLVLKWSPRAPSKVAINTLPLVQIFALTMSVQYRQDMPPPGGFDAVRYKRNLPFRGPSGLAILGAVTAVCAYGFYRVGKGNLERRELQREKVWSRVHLVPLLLAEGDRDAYRREEAMLERERVIMQDVKDWEPGKSVYNGSRYRSMESIVIL